MKTGERVFSTVVAAFLAAGFALGSAFSPRAALAADQDAQFSAQVDRDNIGLDDTVTLKMSLTTDGNATASAPTFSAPDFDVVNSYDSSFVESYYDANSGRFGMKNSHQISKVLRPTKQGDLRITHLQVRMNNQVRSAPDLLIHVSSGGAGTPPPRAYGGGGVGLRGAGKPSANKVFLRAEVDKDHVYKGEQLVVSYYLYRRVRMLNVQVDKFPQLPAFLREELEMPVMQPRMDSETVVLDGVAYQRSLLARYAAYPLQEGALTLDPMGVKYTYYSDPGITDDGDDPIMNFFRTMAPREASAQSPDVKVNVVPLPADGRPSSFSGGVGDFNVISAVDRTQVRANEAVTVTIKVEGRGNVSAIGLPAIKWPANVEVYDTKSSSKSGKAGVGEKIFEVLLIPRQTGSLTLPGVEFSFFDPDKKQYSTRSTEPIQITVTDAAPGASTPPPSALAQSPQIGAPEGAAPESATHDFKDQLKGLKTPLADAASGIPFWRVIYYLAIASIGVFVLIVGRDCIKLVRGQGARSKTARSRDQAKNWDRLRKAAQGAKTGLSWAELARTYENLESVLLEAIDQAYEIGARSLPRAELKRILVEEKGLKEDQWTPIERVLEFSEAIRFGGSASALEARARNELEGWVDSARRASLALEAADRL